MDLGAGVRKLALGALAVSSFFAGSSAIAHAQAAAAKKPNILVIFGDDVGYFNISAYNLGMMGYKTPNIDRLAHEGALFTDAYAQQSCTAGRAAFITGQSPIRTGLFKVGFVPRGVFKCKATATDNPAPSDPRFGPWGKQTCEDTGPLTKKRMETADDEFLAVTLEDMDRAVKAGKPFFIWHNTTRMHIWTHLPPKYMAMVNEKGLYGAGMTQLDDNIGVLLKKLDDLGIAENTIVIFTTDNGAEAMSWPDGGTTPFRGEKNTSWEGGYRVPFVIRWPGVIKPGTAVNDICAHEDWVTTLMAAAGVPDVKEKLLTGYQAGSMTYKVHLDGYNFMPYFQGEVQESPRREFLYWTDDGDLAALRYNRWKLMFLVQRAEGFAVWQEPFV